MKHTPHEAGGARYVVWRLDDNGNEFPVRSFDTRDEAEALRQALTERGHKQSYWVRRMPPGGESRLP